MVHQQPENRLTPWRNDPVSDQPGEVVFSSATKPARLVGDTSSAAMEYITRHGQGYSVFEHTKSELGSELLLFVSPDEPIKFFRITLRNRSSRRRRCSVTLYVEWVLGENRSRTSAHIVTKLEPATGAVTARNVFRQEFGSRVAFLDLWEGHTRSVTGDRTEFIGRNGSLARAAAQRRVELSDRVGSAFDPCGAIRVRVDLGPGQEQVLIGVLGCQDGVCAGSVERHRNRDVVDKALSRTTSYWNDLLGVINVRTPDRAMDLMLNRWLLYQTLACRVWGRSAFYQSSGAFGFRDQLQDTLALLLSAPALVRENHPSRGIPPIPRGDVPALVARARRTGSTDPVLRRQALVGLCHAPVPERDRRRNGARRSGALPSSATAESGRA